MRGYADNGIVAKVREAGGEIYAIASEPQTLASRAQAEWETDFEAVGDPHHEISGACQQRGLLELVVNDRMKYMKRAVAGMDVDWSPQHPKGYFQPGVLALSAGGRVLYRWRSIPTRRNLGGATGRPTAAYVWDRIRAALEQPTDAPDASLDADPQLDEDRLPFPLFVGLLLAKGWFHRAGAFSEQPGGPSGPQQVLRAALRVPLFLAAWAAAFWFLPMLWVGAALALWVAWITPEVRLVLRDFQSLAVEPLSR